MKKLIISTICTFTITLVAVAQEKIDVMRYEYGVTFKPSVVSDEVKTETVYLDVWDSSSRFYSEGYAKRTERLTKTGQLAFLGVNFDMSGETTFFKEIVVKEIDKQYYVERISALLKIEYPVNIVKWIIDSATEKYEGMTVQKAVGELNGRTWTVWFTTEIPLIEGPYKFKNLPGFVVKAVDDKQDYLFEFRKSEKVQVPLHFYEYEKAAIIKEKDLIRARELRANKSLKQDFAEKGIQIYLEDTVENQQSMSKKIGDNTNYMEWLKK
ncbi:GLPGLI family protein [Myroides marinus]|uniref:GLPGLI family protein n=1 Tax=Myroides marinus TaxID=703342 RepID=UPI002578B5A0|nr:GLPGLI family protein [Myroides marinus]MDM1350188.1 GLPGLI family protein [Myroides marinus]MDM1357395.1 GLPGLI family protein [Myroides marinus]MDM1364818.1 GLPGLI family protein [Myroides marinus]MDM1370558.1 GLPGLI family protein [Myroides marinus]